MNRLTRGELAKLSGVKSASIRYYEKIGLLPEPPRSHAGYRMFSPESVNRIRFIKEAQELGFSLKEIKELLDLRVTPGATTSDVRKRTIEKINDIADKIKRLREMKISLEGMVNSCCADASASECPILENLGSKNIFHNEVKIMKNKRKVEVFSAGCGVCDEAVQLVEQIACESCEVEVLDTRQKDVAERAKEYGIKTVPAIVIDGKLADCCSNQIINEEALRAEGLGVPLS